MDEVKAQRGGAAGLTDHVWSSEEIVRLLEMAEKKPAT
jgi:hypothetical protein